MSQRSRCASKYTHNHTAQYSILILNPRKSLPRQPGFIGDARMNVLLTRDHARVLLVDVQILHEQL